MTYSELKNLVVSCGVHAGIPEKNMLAMLDSAGVVRTASTVISDLWILNKEETEQTVMLRRQMLHLGNTGAFDVTEEETK